VGSNPAAPTQKTVKNFWLSFALYCRLHTTKFFFLRNPKKCNTMHIRFDFGLLRGDSFMSSPQAVGKPTNAGSGQVAIANTTGAYINVRNGPGTQYRDIGDLRENTLVLQYPSSLREGWVWIEQRGMNGWVSNSVVQFEPAVGNIPTNQTPTPYDGAVAVWHWKGSGIGEKSIEELVANLKKRAPNVRQIWVKTSDGASWQGKFDAGGGNMAINSAADIVRWVQILQQNNLEFHAWCVPTGTNIDGEAAVISAVCKVAGVKSMILDVEPYTGFFTAGRQAVRPLMTKIRQQVGGRFHIGMSMDPRPQHKESIFPDEWFPFINSLHPQVYWATFRNDPEAALQSAYDVWKGFGRPIIPALQGDGALIDQKTAQTLATQRHGAMGVSWWRYGVISQYEAVNTTITLVPPDKPITNPTDNFTDEVIIVPKGTGFRSGTYTGKPEFSEFVGTWGWTVLYKKTELNTSKVWAEWKADLPESGRYDISVFVSARHSTTRRARYKIHGVKGTNTEVVVDLNQAQTRNVWVTLGIFDLVKGAPNAGKVALNDVTGESDKEIEFDAVRFRRIVTTTVPSTPTNPPTGTTRPSIVNGVRVSDGYDSPTGTDVQRRSTIVWPQGWSDASPFGRLYFIGTPSEAYHTGADLNFGAPRADLGMPVYSCANGVVTFAARLPTWGNVIIIRHDPLYTPSGAVIYSRYGHVQNMRVKVGDRVTRGQQICEIGDAFGRFIPHLHFDLSPTTILETTPSDWPAKDYNRLIRNYIDPLAYIRSNRP
jgi:murein DD-endopeptidase MepM/ murein hydrolase activator NlpD